MDGVRNGQVQELTRGRIPTSTLAMPARKPVADGYSRRTSLIEES